MKKKTQKVFVDEGLGFKVRIRNVPMIWVRQAWTPNINYNKLTTVVLRELCQKDSRLTGAEIKFVRQHFGMTLQAFAARFCVTHAAVIKWERAGAKPSAMSWTTEKDLRLFVLLKLAASPEELSTLYGDLEQKRTTKTCNLRVDAGMVAM